MQDEPGEEPTVFQRRAVLPSLSMTWAAEQRRDPELSWVEAGQCPCWENVAAHGVTERGLWSMQDGLVLRSGVLKWRWVELVMADCYPQVLLQVGP